MDPKTALLHSIKQDLKAEVVGYSIDSKLAIFVTSLLTKGLDKREMCLATKQHQTLFGYQTC